MSVPDPSSFQGSVNVLRQPRDTRLHIHEVCVQRKHRILEKGSNGGASSRARGTPRFGCAPLGNGTETESHVNRVVPVRQWLAPNASGTAALDRHGAAPQQHSRMRGSPRPIPVRASDDRFVVQVPPLFLRSVPLHPNRYDRENRVGPPAVDFSVSVGPAPHSDDHSLLLGARPAEAIVQWLQTNGSAENASVPLVGAADQPIAHRTRSSTRNNTLGPRKKRKRNL